MAETTYLGHRLIVRRTRLVGEQATLWPDWRHHAFVTDREGSAVELDADDRRHAVCELAIRDLKEGAGANHCPSGRFGANVAWLVLATLAHDLVRWVAATGLGIPGAVVAATIRRPFLTLPRRHNRSGRQRRLRLPRSWPPSFEEVLAWLRCVRPGDLTHRSTQHAQQVGTRQHPGFSCHAQGRLRGQAIGP